MSLWRKRLAVRLPPLGSRVRVSVTPCGFRGGRNEVWVGFSWGFSHFPLLQISFHHFSTLISSISFHFITPCDGASVVVAGTLATHGPIIQGLHRISSLDPTLCWTRVQDIYFLFYLVSSELTSKQMSLPAFMRISAFSLIFCKCSPNILSSST